MLHFSTFVSSSYYYIPREEISLTELVLGERAFMEENLMMKISKSSTMVPDTSAWLMVQYLQCLDLLMI
jgi:hypothetical protein